MVGCLREGPGVRTTGGGVTAAQGVQWGTCLLPEDCSAYNWQMLSDSSSEFVCGDPACLTSGGLCLPAATNISACICPPGYTGPSCNQPYNSCSQNPCQNRANCTDNPDISQGYFCQCDGTGYSGIYCHQE